VASTDPFRVWIPVEKSDHPLVQKSKCHRSLQRSNSESTQQTHRDTHALYQKKHS
jgi:hypothetical protein